MRSGKDMFAITRPRTKRDRHSDIAPYSPDQHLKLQIERWVTTSFGLIIRKGGA